MQIALYLEFMLLCIFILTLILIHAVQGVSRGKGWRLFISTIVCALGCQILDLFWGLIDMEALTVPVFIHFIISALYFVATETLSFCWFFYSEYTQDSSLVKTERNMALCSIPYFLSIALLVVTCWNGCIFYIDSSNVYHRGSFYGLYELLAYGYILFTSIKALIKALNKSNYVRRRDYLILASFAIFPCILGFIQNFTPTMSMIGMGITLAVVQVYLVSQETLISLDPLTRLNNRNQLLKYLSGKIKSAGEKGQLYLLIMDVDNFKTINDKYGHVEGDNALLRIADVLKLLCVQKDYFVSRYGGDEFIMVCEAESRTEIDMLCHKIEEALEKLNQTYSTPYSLSLSIGCAHYTEDIQSIPDFIARADETLYKVKKKRHGRLH